MYSRLILPFKELIVNKIFNTWNKKRHSENFKANKKESFAGLFSYGQVGEPYTPLTCLQLWETDRLRIILTDNSGVENSNFSLTNGGGQECQLQRMWKT